MRHLLTGKDFWDIIGKGYIEPTNWSTLKGDDLKSGREEMKKNSLTLWYIESTLNDDLFPIITTTKITQEAWTSLKEAYEGSDQVKVVKIETLKKDFKNLMMKETKRMGDYCVD